MSRLIAETKVLLKESGAGQIRQWQGQVVEIDGQYFSRKIYGQKDGKQTTQDDLAEPKNVGRSNETTAQEQAIKEMEADEAKKRKGGYSETVTKSDTIFKPMRLNTYVDEKGGGCRHKFNWENGAYAAEKLNGICYMVSLENQWTRGMEITSVPQLMVPITLDFTLIGELYIPGEPSTLIAGGLRGQKDEILQRAIYAVFDCYRVGGTETFEERRAYIESLELPPPFTKHLGVWVADEKEALALHSNFVTNGAEGTIVREPKGLYKPDYRSYSVQRIKDSDSDIVTITEVTKDSRGCAMFTVRLEKYGEVLDFEVTPTGSLDSRRTIYDSGDHYVGKTVKIKYAGYGQNGIPLFANALIETLN